MSKTKILLLFIFLVVANAFAQGTAEKIISKGKGYVNQEKLNKAMAEFEKAIKINPNNIDAYCNRAVIYELEGLYDQALSDYDSAIEIDRQHCAGALFQKAMLLEKIGRIDEAIKVYKEFIPLAEKEDSLVTRPLNPGWFSAIETAKKKIAESEKTTSAPK